MTVSSMRPQTGGVAECGGSEVQRQPAQPADQPAISVHHDGQGVRCRHRGTVSRPSRWADEGCGLGGGVGWVSGEAAAAPARPSDEFRRCLERSRRGGRQEHGHQLGAEPGTGRQVQHRHAAKAETKLTRERERAEAE